jgi:hypothetical protein
MLLLLAGLAAGDVYSVDLRSEKVRMARRRPGRGTEFLNFSTGSDEVRNVVAFGGATSDDVLDLQNWNVGAEASHLASATHRPFLRICDADRPIAHADFEAIAFLFKVLSPVTPFDEASVILPTAASICVRCRTAELFRAFGFRAVRIVTAQTALVRQFLPSAGRGRFLLVDLHEKAAEFTQLTVTDSPERREATIAPRSRCEKLLGTNKLMKILRRELSRFQRRVSLRFVREHLESRAGEADYSDLPYFTKFSEVLSEFDEPAAVYIAGEFAQVSTFSSCIRAVWSGTEIVCRTDPRLWLLGGLAPPEKAALLNGTVVAEPSTVAYDVLLYGQPPLIVRKGDFVSCGDPHWVPFATDVLFVAEGREVTIAYYDLVTNTLDGFVDLYLANEKSLADPSSVLIELRFCQSGALDAPDLTEAYVNFTFSVADDRIHRYRLKVKQPIVEVIWPRRKYIDQFAKVVSTRRNAQNHSSELADFVWSLKRKALHNIEFEAITTKQERSEIITAISRVGADNPQGQLKRLKEEFDPVLARYSDHMKKQPALVKLHKLIEAAPQYLTESRASNETIAAFNNSLHQLRTFCRRAMSNPSLTISDIDQATATLERAVETVKHRTMEVEVKVGADGQIDKDTMKFFEEMGIPLADVQKAISGAEGNLGVVVADDEDFDPDNIPDEL